MNNDHPITPPPELVEQWSAEIYEQTACEEITCSQHIATQAARWGADQELEACCDVILAYQGLEHPELLVEILRSARRPKPLSLKERALQAMDRVDVIWDTDEFGKETMDDINAIRRALESLPD